MKKVIEGKVYNTDTATRVCSVRCDTESVSDFDWHETALYRSPKGTYFIAGEGNARSMWARSAGQRSWSGGSGLRVVTLAEAKEIAENAGLSPARMEAAGFELDEG
jgi:hypothetical protein